MIIAKEPNSYRKPPPFADILHLFAPNPSTQVQGKAAVTFCLYIHIRKVYLKMCDNIYALFSCADEHEAKGESRTRLKRIKTCHLFNVNNETCTDRDDIHMISENETWHECPECRGEIPPQSPDA
ncbi:hypothetical protein F5Y06DRAFT_270510 [Hypoxylon sp. FL0890]|nr:hypothetical protein F5Y06DRAFT_270510 [Hypoxylon sp. FL0890]